MPSDPILSEISSESSDSNAPTTLVLIDGHALAYRNYFALPALSNSRGESTHAILGFIRQTLRLARQSGNQVVVVFDPPGGTFRHEQYEGYKAGRNKTPADLPPQIDRIRELLDALGLKRLEQTGYEADDVIASLTKRAEGSGMQVRILTSDRDAYQLLDENVRVITSKGSLFGPDEVLEKYGVSVSQWVDFRALTGDSSDNIPGAKGIGPKTAEKLLKEFGTLDAVLAAAKAGEIKPAGTQKKLLASEGDVLLSRQLSQMVTGLELDFELGAPRAQGDPARLNDLLDELELDSLRDEIGRFVAGEMTPAPEQPPRVEAFVPPAIAPDWQPPDWQPPAQAEAAAPVWGYLLSRPDDLTADLLGAAWWQPAAAEPEATTDGVETGTEAGGLAYAVPEREEQQALFGLDPSGEQPEQRGKKKPASQPKADQQVLAEALAGQRLDAAEAKALAAWLLVRGVEVALGDDPLLLAYVLDSGNTTMSAVAKRYLDAEWPSEAGKGEAGAGGSLQNAAATRAAMSARLLRDLPAQLTAQQRKLYQEIERPLSGVLARMEARGVQLDSDYLRGLSGAVTARIAGLEERIFEAAGHQFSIRSRDQLATVLYDELGLATSKKTKLTGKRSTAVSALEPLRDEHPIIPLILEYREAEKLRGTYLDPLPKLVNPRTGRLHTTFNQTGVATGRLSSLNPNLQNIPVRTEEGRQIRKGFVAAPHCVLIAADYSQLELRLMAHLSGDSAMQRAFKDGADIHRRTAAEVLGLEEGAVTPDQRRAAKTVNFGVLYGMSAHRLSNELHIPYAEAAEFIENYFAIYPGIQGFIGATLEQGRTKGYVETLYGRRRYVPELHARNHNLRAAGERLAYNMPIQGTAADIMKIAMIALEPQLEQLGAQMLLQVHDELLIEAPQDKAEAVVALVVEVMEGAAALDVPLAVDVGIADNWYEAK